MKRSTQLSFVDTTWPALLSSFPVSTVHRLVVVLIVVASALWTTAVRAERVLGLVPTPSDPIADQSMHHIAQRLGDQLVVATTTSGATHDSLAQRASRAPFVIGMDPSQGQVSAFRSSDGTFLIRRMRPKAWRDSPYSASLVALELLNLVREAPRVPVVGQPAKAKPAAAPTPGWSLNVGVESGGAVDWSAGNETTLARPFVAADVGLALDPIDLALQVRAAGFGKKRAVLDGEEINYMRHDLDAGLGVGLRLDNYWFGSSLRLGLSVVDVSLSNAPIDDRRFVLWSGLSFGARRQLGAGFAVGLTTDVAWLPQPPRFLVMSTPVLFERGFRLRVALSIRWATD